jgi:hypothetical protein
MTEDNNPEKQDGIRNPDGTFKSGVSGNPNGRPKGKTLKEWARDKLMNMTDEEREEFIKTLPKDIVWRMAEGNPAQNNDITSGGKPIYFPNELIKKNESHQVTEDNSEESEQV